MHTNKINIRMAQKEDADLIVKYIKDLAAYERELDQVSVTVQAIEQEMFEKQGAEALLAEIDGKPAGFALFHRSFSTFLGKSGITLVDLYVEPHMRGKGCGKQMVAHLAYLAESNKMKRLEWWVHDWNRDAMKHYQSWGAFQVPYIRVCRLCDDALRSLASQSFCEAAEKRERLLETDRLWVTKAREVDIESIIALESHSENRDYLWIGTPEEHRKEIYDPNHELLVFEEKVSKKMVGYALNRLDYISNKWELRRIAISEKRRGYGKEVIKGLLEYAFHELNMNRFWLDVYPDNMGGIKLYEGLGMHCDGVLRQNYKSQRGYIDQIIYSILREEYNGENQF